MSVLAVLLPFLVPALGDWQRSTLSNGTTALVLEVADAPRQSTFTFLPFGLTDDDTGCSQHTHLLEHLLIRSTDPDALVVDGVQRNGETTALTMRLESFAEPGNFEAAVRRHVRWWSARSVDPEVLEREKGRVLAEVDSTSRTGFTHKFSLAALGQALRGRELAAVRGDVLAASAAQLEAQMRSRLDAPETILLVSIGPVHAEEVLRVLEDELKSPAAPEGERSRPLRSPLAPTAGDAPALEGGPDAFERPPLRWDVSTSHLLEWYEVPAATLEDRTAAEVLVAAANVFLMQAPRLAASGVQAVAFPARLGERRFVVLSAASNRGVPPEEWRESWSQVHAAMGTLAGIEALALQVAGQLDPQPDFAGLRRRLAGRPGAEFLEAQFAMNAGYLQMRCGAPLADLLRTTRSLDAADLRARAERAFAAENRRSLRLVPDDS